MRGIKLIRIATVGICLLTLLTGLNRNNAQADNLAETTDARTVASQNVSLIELKHDHLTVKVQDISLKELIEEIARQADLTLRVSTSLKEQITLEFHGLPLDVGLRRILGSHGYALEYAEKTSEKAQSAVLLPRTLWIYSEGVGTSSEHIVGKREDGYSQPMVIAKPEWQDAMMSKDPAERQESYEAIVKALPGEDPEVLEEVEESLREFEKAMTEQDLEAENEAVQGSEVMEQAETP